MLNLTYQIGELMMYVYVVNEGKEKRQKFENICEVTSIYFKKMLRIYLCNFIVIVSFINNLLYDIEFYQWIIINS